ncbi:MAG: lipoate--protein ligase [Opitutales bacterium]|nr:lipoate--protein ligase [Opitutales bacterium]
MIPQSTDPAFNLGLEEYLLRNSDEEYLLLWRDEPCIVVGRHQLTSQEINHEYVCKHLLPVVRRISGGGTVYHDHGNLNYTFISNVEKNREIDYGRYCLPIVYALRRFGVKAELVGKSDICIGECKISGTAIYMHRNRVLHHGTLLFDADLDTLRQVLRAPHKRYTSRAIASNRSKVTNICEHIGRYMGFDEFYVRMAQELGKQFSLSQWTPTPEMIREAFLLKQNKYDDTEWNFGEDPSAIYEHKRSIGEHMARCHLQLEAGHILAAGVFIDRKPEASEHLEELLQGERHDYERIRDKLVSFDFMQELGNVKVTDILQLLF